MGQDVREIRGSPGMKPAGVAATVAELAVAVGGRLSGGAGDRPFHGASIDSRTVQSAGVFFAMKGGHTDGHRFIGVANRRKAAAAVVERAVKAPAGFPLIRVRSTPDALGVGGAWWRRRAHVPVVAVTGSNGKTTAKDLCAHLLRAVGPVTATKGNLNNALGVPLTLFEITGGEGAVVVEIAMNRPGEIADLAKMAAPTAGVVLNAGLAHGWKFPSRHEVAREKTSLVAALPAGGWAFLNADDREVWGFRGRTKARVLGFGLKGGDVRAGSARIDREGRLSFRLYTPTGSAPVRTRLLGVHNAWNAAAAAAVAWAFGMDVREISRKLESFSSPSAMRMERRRLRGGAVALLDCYNSNPGSLDAALDFVAATRSKKPVLVLGEMRELGGHSVREHASAGRKAASLHPALLVGVGPGAWPLVASARTAGVREAVWVRDGMDALDAVSSAISRGTLVLFKASRAVRLERLATALGGGKRNAV